jgi:hypothetical protein
MSIFKRCFRIGPIMTCVLPAAVVFATLLVARTQGPRPQMMTDSCYWKAG